MKEFQFFDLNQILRLAVDRLRSIAGADPRLTGPQDIPPFTYALAHSLAPPNCQLASIDSPSDEARLDDVIQPGASAWVGIAKEFQSAYFDALAGSVKDRREGWFNVATGEEIDETLWNVNQPFALPMGASTTQTANAAVWRLGEGLLAVPSTSQKDGAIYECCAEVLPACFGSGLGNLEDVLVPLLQQKF